jgi:beta-lactam-binding protein with PASTA domain
MTLRERVHWLLRLALGLFILASVTFLSALTAMRFAVQGREVKIPDLTGKSSADAQQILQMRRVGMKVEDKLYSSYPVDSIVRQSPAPDMNLKVGEDVYVVVSLGSQKETIPLLEQNTLRAARIELLRSGLQIGEVSNVYLGDQPADTVLMQDPAPGQQNVTSPHVDFLVSLGPRPGAFVMPDLTGLPFAEAQLRLTSAGLKLAKVTPVPAPGAVPSSVVSQTPVRGQKADPSTSVDLQVAQ